MIRTLELLRIEEYLPYYSGCVGHPEAERSVIARAFVAKAVYNMPTTRMLIDRLHTDIQIKRICGWERKNEIPSESTFSRAFADFSKSHLLERIQKTFISEQYKDEIIGHISRDSTVIEAREKPTKKVPKVGALGEGNSSHWIGYKLHIDAVDSGIPTANLSKFA